MRLTVQFMRGDADLFTLILFKMRDQICPIVIRRRIEMLCAGTIELFGSVRDTATVAFDGKIRRLGILVDIKIHRISAVNILGVTDQDLRGKISFHPDQSDLLDSVIGAIPVGNTAVLDIIITKNMTGARHFGLLPLQKIAYFGAISTGIGLARFIHQHA